MRLSRTLATGHGDWVGWIEARRRVCPKEMYCYIVTCNKRSLRTRFAKRDELTKIGPDRCRARTEIAVRVLQHANIHPKCAVEQILSQHSPPDIKRLPHPHKFENRHGVWVADALFGRDAARG